MDTQFEHLCRICAANTKSKSNSVVESVFIFKTVGLKDKILRHLYLNCDEHDPLPKVLCKSCYRKVEATASLSNIAMHTQRVFRDFLLSTVPKHAREVTAALLEAPLAVPPLVASPLVPPAGLQGSSGFSTSSLPFEQRRSNTDNPDAFRPIVLSRAQETTITLAPPPPPPPASNSSRDEVVISLTKKDSQGKQSLQQQQRSATYGSGSDTQSSNVAGLGLARRNSVFGESRYGSAPMSIAQRSMQMPPSLAPLHPEVTLSKTTKASGQEKKPSPAGVINFIQTHGRITGSTAPSNNSSNKSGSTSVNVANPVSKSPLNNPGVPNLPSSVIQQKRRNLKNTLNNIKAIQSGQVSLLKSSQQRQDQQPEDKQIRPLVTTTVVPHKLMFSGEPSVEEALPEHIIIAAPKKKKEESPLGSGGPPKLLKLPPAAAKPKINSPTPVAPPTAKQPTSVAATGVASAAPTAPPGAASTKEMKNKLPANMNSLTEAIALGNVIRDPDLLKLILTALKWPVTADNSDEQMTRLKSSKFAVIMSDSNLLQDNDLTQLLGPYVGPMLAVAQQQQKQKQATTATSTPSPTPSPPQALNDLASAMPYKLPPETSVQLVPSSPTELEPPQTVLSGKKISPIAAQAKQPQRKLGTRDSTLREHVSEERQSSSNAARVTNELLNLNAMLLAQFSNNPADALNEALISMLRQQQLDTKGRRQSRRRRSISPASNGAGINLEDIVLMEPQPVLEPAVELQSTPPRQASPMAVRAATPANSETVGFKLPLQKTPEPPLITRPIIKRRKIVIQASKQRDSAIAETAAVSPKKEPITPTKASDELPTDNQPVEQTKADDFPPVAPQPVKETPLQTPSSTVTEAASNSEGSEAEPEQTQTQAQKPSESGNGSSQNNNAVEVRSTNSSAGPSSEANKTVGVLGGRKSIEKSALGQKLLEAIGVQQLGKNVAAENSRDTLRSALKRSLKQAQEQQQLKRVKQEEPVKQLADSTTKPSASESAEEHKKAIAERELALLKRKSKSASELEKRMPKEEKSERTDVSSSSSRNRRQRKLKIDATEEEAASAEEKRSERWDEDDDLPLKAENEKSPERSTSSGGGGGSGSRPTRTSKTNSKYYKSPGNEKSRTVEAQKSQHAMGTRSTRQR